MLRATNRQVSIGSIMIVIAVLAVLLAASVEFARGSVAPILLLLVLMMILVIAAFSPGHFRLALGIQVEESPRAHAARRVEVDGGYWARADDAWIELEVMCFGGPHRRLDQALDAERVIEGNVAGRRCFCRRHWRTKQPLDMTDRGSVLVHHPAHGVCLIRSKPVMRASLSSPAEVNVSDTRRENPA
jgi:hypothetical protein